MGWAEALQALGKDLTALPQTLRQREQLELEKQLRPLQIQAQQAQIAGAQQQQALAARDQQLSEAKIASEGIGFDRPVGADTDIWQSLKGTPYSAPFEATGGLMPGQAMHMDDTGNVVPGGEGLPEALGVGTLTQGPAQMLKRPSFNETQLIKQEENARRAAEAQQKIAQGLRRIDQGDVRNDQGQQRIGISQANADSLALYRDALKAGLTAGQGGNDETRYINQAQWVMKDGHEQLVPVSEVVEQGYTRAPTADMRNRLVAREQALPVMNSIQELSAKINTGQGVLAKVKGGIETQKARVNLNNDVAEYVSLVSMYTPILARAVGHTGVLTEQDVQSVREGLPHPGDSEELALRKLARAQHLMNAVNALLRGGGGQGAAPPTGNQAPAGAPPAPVAPSAAPAGPAVGSRRQTRDGRTVEWDGNGWRLVQ